MALGLEAVSLRKVAAALDVGPMRLYGYIATKDELLDLMVDAVHAEIRPAGDGWREVLGSLAETTRQAAHQHEWLADLIGGRPQLGPHALARGEAVLAAIQARRNPSPAERRWVGTAPRAGFDDLAVDVLVERVRRPRGRRPG